MSELIKQQPPVTPPGFLRNPRVLALAALTSTALLAGCASLQTPFAGMFGGAKSEEEEIRRLTDTSGVKGPLQRLISGGTRAQSLAPAAGREEYERALALFKAGKYEAAERMADKVADKYKNSPVREDAIFLTAESQFKQKRYSWAQDSYDLLVKEFPATRYMETRNKRLFNIARYWLQDPQYVTADNVKAAEFNPTGSQKRATVEASPRKAGGFDITRTIPILPNFRDRSRPVFDTEGRALQALKSIWLSDPTGSLADDALMLEASHHMRNGNYLEADRIYTILRDEYSKSPHAENAYVLGAFVKQASYQGPEYDPQVLNDAEQLKKSTLRLYPKHPDRERMLRDLRKIELAKAASDWDMVRFYRRKNRPVSVAVYCRYIIKTYPESEYAARARKLLTEIGEPVDPGDRRPPVKKPQTSEPGLFHVPKITLPALPRLSLPGFGSDKPAPPKTPENSDPQVGNRDGARR
jgi:outer membrane protein assembly factor BamD (BamD/ComL family)